MILYDTHTHLNDEAYADDLEDVIARAREAGILYMNVIGYDLPSSERALALAKANEGIYAVIGVHPHDSDSWNPETEKRLREMLDANTDRKIVAIGEIGLDYHFDDRQPDAVQKQAFQGQMRLAAEYDLPIVIHDRDAHQDTLDQIMEVKEAGVEVRGVFHCYSGSEEFSKRLLNLGFLLGFDGPVTFKNGKKPLAVALSTPEDMLLLETDCPYLSPEPFRGKRNEPAYLIHIVEKLALAKGLPTEDLAALTTENAIQLFDICRFV